MNLNLYGFPVPDADETGTGVFVFDTSPTLVEPINLRFEQAKQYAAEARTRNFPRECECATCVSVRNLPGVLRVIAKWRLKGDE